MATVSQTHSEVPTFPGETRSNEVRRLTSAVEPKALRTYTPSQLVIASSSGCYHWTPEGRKLADFSSGVLVANLGHHPAGWWQRVWDYMGLPAGRNAEADSEFLTALPLTSYNALSELELLAAQRLISSLQGQPGGERCEQVIWAASGSEAVQKALWAALARRPGQDIILATRQGFHGKKGLAGAVTGDEQAPERDSRVQFLSFPTDQCQNVSRRRQRLDLTSFQQELESLWQTFGSRICCLITEPYLGGGGSYHPQPEYLQLLQDFCYEHDLLFILDEVQSNFGRTGQMYAFSHYGLTPDIVVLGKGLGNGVAVSAAVGRADVFSQLGYGEASDTWSGNPLSCAAVLATLDAFESSSVLAHAQSLSRVIERALLGMQNHLEIVAHVRGEGTVWGVECSPLGAATAAEVAAACVRACYLGDQPAEKESGNSEAFEQQTAAGIHLLGPLAGKVLRVSPPLVMPLGEAEESFQLMHRLLARVEQELCSAP